MMLGLGVGGWVAGLFHLLTHAFFKALLFLGAGSVYHSVHTYEMPALGGLLKKMPITALHDAGRHAGDLGRARSSAGSTPRTRSWRRRWPGSGTSPQHFLLFLLPAVGAILTAFYMFRMWFLTFAGEPRGFARRRVADGCRLTRSRRRARPLDARITAPATAMAHGARPEPGRPRPRERADHDLAAHHPGGVAASSPAGRSGTSSPTLPFGTPLAGADARIRRAVPGHRSDCCTGLHWYALAGSLVIMLTGHRPGVALLRAARASPTSCRPGSARPGRPSGSAASTASWSTSGTSTSSTGPCSSGRAWPSPGSAARSTRS